MSTGAPNGTACSASVGDETPRHVAPPSSAAADASSNPWPYPLAFTTAMTPTPGPSIAFTAAALSEIAAVSTSTHFCGCTLVLPAGPVRAGDDLEEVSVRVPEVHASTAVVAVDLPPPPERRIGPVLEPPLGDPTEDLVELVLADEERVVLRRDLAVHVVIVERHAVAGLADTERPARRRLRQPEELGEERRRALLVPAPDDRVVELHAHAFTLPSAGPGDPLRTVSLAPSPSHRLPRLPHRYGGFLPRPPLPL